MFVDISILNADLENIEKFLEPINDIKYIHMDIMDGKFVKETSFDEKIVKRCSNYLKDSIIDVHLMVEDPEKEFIKYKEAGADYITFHYEVGKIKERIDMIHSLGLKAGLSINPDTDVMLIKDYLKDLDEVLIMSVYPGRGGQKYIESSTDKLKFLKEYKISNNLNYLINVDGGINFDTIDNVINYIDLVVIGSAITKKENYKEIYNEYKKILEKEV